MVHNTEQISTSHRDFGLSFEIAKSRCAINQQWTHLIILASIREDTKAFQIEVNQSS
jgi:hypothetical protein